jgi:predicted glutamine amidotransferase
MCRIFYALNQSNIKSKINDFLLQSDIDPISKDGHGLAVLTSANRWKLYKSISPDPTRQKIIDYSAGYSLIVGHLRRIIMKHHPSNSDARLENTHPFYYKNRIFLHNGTFEDSKPPEQLSKWFQQHIFPE